MTRDERRQAEVEHGRMVTRRNMMAGLIEEIEGDLKKICPNIECLIVSNQDTDIRTWVVTTNHKPSGQSFQESLWDFPTTELKTKLMLLG